MNGLKLARARRFPFAFAPPRRFKHFITTPIFYVNGEPHIGHLYTSVLADANFRWSRLKRGRDPYMPGAAINESDEDIFVVGTDEHGMKVERAAERAGKTPQEHCDFYSERFRELYHAFNINYTKFIRTSDPAHTKAVQEFWERLKSRGHIYKGIYEGWYSIRDECFYADDEVEDVEEDGKRVMVSKETRAHVEWTKEENYMFDWTKFQDKIREWLLNNEAIAPSSNLPPLLQSLKHEQPLSLSRSSSRLKWGIRVPGDESQTIYVWFDALVSYLTAGGFPDGDFKWPADVHFVGKDIRTFHALYWPAFLMAADLPLPKSVYVHCHWLADGTKMSKSIGNVVNPFLVSNLLTADGLRYFMLKQGTLHNDANFTMTKAVHTVNADLVNNLANLVTRATANTMCPKQKYPSFDVEVMEYVLKGSGETLALSVNQLAARVSDHYDKQQFHRGLEAIAEVGNHANAFFQLHAPWKLKEGPEKQTILFIVCETARIASLLLQPIVPDYARRMLARLGLQQNEFALETAKLGGGPNLKLYGRPFGETPMIMKRIEFKTEPPVSYESVKIRRSR
ncbi:Methionine--tRNA ligase, mitochondrial [Aphelenchoides fujianensis]|nr:Methionine--tRNA ligase, mitochondrial [Aphelenchoides fujianensis]